MNVTGFNFDSSALYDWVGTTTNQNSIISNYYNNKTLSEYSNFFLEFRQPIKAGVLELFYNVNTHYNYSSFSVGMNFPPIISIKLNESFVASRLLDETNKLYELLALFIGSDFPLDVINVGVESYINHQKACMYYSTDNRKFLMKSPVFPLGHDLALNDLGLGSLPLESFNNYYKLSDKELTLYRKYLRYKRLNSNEERFLGYFRLLEKITHKEKSYVNEESLDRVLKESLVKVLKESKNCLVMQLDSNNKNVSDLIARVKKINLSKYNTEKCVKDFYKRVLEEINADELNNSVDIKAICDLRNNITHANDYSLDDNELQKYTAFVEVLLYLALLEKIGVSLEIGGTVIHRLTVFHYVQHW